MSCLTEVRCFEVNTAIGTFRYGSRGAVQARCPRFDFWELLAFLLSSILTSNIKIIFSYPRAAVLQLGYMLVKIK